MVSKMEPFFTRHFSRLWLVWLALVAVLLSGRAASCGSCVGSKDFVICTAQSPLLGSLFAALSADRTCWIRLGEDKRVRILPCIFGTPNITSNPGPVLNTHTQQELGTGTSSCHGGEALDSGHGGKRWDG